MGFLAVRDQATRSPLYSGDGTEPAVQFAKLQKARWAHNKYEKVKRTLLQSLVGKVNSVAAVGSLVAVLSPFCAVAISYFELGRCRSVPLKGAFAYVTLLFKEGWVMRDHHDAY